MEILLAYLKENSPNSSAGHKFDAQLLSEVDGPSELSEAISARYDPFERYEGEIWNYRKFILSQADIQAIVTVIGRRTEEQRQEEQKTSGFSLKIFHTDFQGIDFASGNFENAIFHQCELDGAKFASAKFNRTRFSPCSAVGAVFIGTFLNESQFDKCKLEGCLFKNCHMKARLLLKCNLCGVHFNRCNLTGARIKGCSAIGSTLTASNIDGTLISSSDFKMSGLAVPNLCQNNNSR